MSSISVRQVNAQTAAEFQSHLRNAPVFVHPRVLDCLVPHTDWWIAARGNEDVCLWPVALDANGRPTIPPFSYYVGPVWAENSFHRPPPHIRSAVHAVYDALIETLINHYGSIQAEFDSYQMDMRPFLWWNFGVPDLPKFDVEPRYTAIIPNLVNSVREEWLRNMRSVRRREVQRISSSSIARQNVMDPQILQRAYANVMERQSISPPNEVYTIIERLWDLTRKGSGWTQRWFVTGDDTPSSICLILKDRVSAHLVLRLSEGCSDYPGLPSLAILDSLDLAKSQGLDRFDFNGANSPNRGDDKHAFGAVPELFFRITLNGMIGTR